MNKRILTLICTLLILSIVSLLFFMFRPIDIEFKENHDDGIIYPMKRLAHYNGSEIYLKQFNILYSINSNGGKKLLGTIDSNSNFAIRGNTQYFLSNEILKILLKNKYSSVEISDVTEFAIFDERVIVLRGKSNSDKTLYIYSTNGDIIVQIDTGQIRGFEIMDETHILYRKNNDQTFHIYDTSSGINTILDVKVNDDLKNSIIENPFVCDSNYIVFYDGFWDSRNILIYDIITSETTILQYDTKQRYKINAGIQNNTLYYSCQAVDVAYWPVEQNSKCGTWKYNLTTKEATRIFEDSAIEFVGDGESMFGVFGVSNKLLLLE